MARKKVSRQELVVRVVGRAHAVADYTARRLLEIARKQGKTAYGPQALRRRVGDLSIPGSDPLSPPTIYPDEHIYRVQIAIEQPDETLVDELTRTPLPGDVRLDFKVYSGADCPKRRSVTPKEV